MSAPPIHVGVITHKFGTNIYAGVTDADVMSQLAQYCREWWDDIPDPDVAVQDPPIDDADCVAAYFKGFDEYGSTESYDIQAAVPLVGQAVSQ